MTDVQLLRLPDGRHPYLSRWCRNEPASTPHRGSSDHWCKMKHRATVLTLRHGKGDTGVSFWSDREPYNYQDETIKRRQLLRREQQYDNGRLSSIGRKSFVELMITGLDGEKPGHFLLPDKKRISDRLRSAANDRAREGFKYWMLEKPVSKGGRYTTGAKTSFLGLGKSFYP